MQLLASSVASRGLLGGLSIENTFSPGPKLSPKRKTEVPTPIYSRKDLLRALCVCVFQANKKLDKYTARCVLYLEDFCLKSDSEGCYICFLLPFVWSPVSLNRHCLYNC